MTDKDMVRLEAGSVVALRMYDLGRAVDVDALAHAAGGDVDRPQFPPSADGLRYNRPPVELTLEDVEIPLEGGRVFADTTVRVFDFGIAAVAMRVLVGGMDWDRFSERVEEIGAAVSGDAQAWRDVEDRVRSTLQPARLRLEGDAIARHVFVIARRFGEAMPVDDLVDEDYAASIVSSEWLPLTATARADLLRGARVSGGNLVVTGEERSFIVEPVPGTGVPDAIEAALAQRAFYDLARSIATGGSTKNGGGPGGGSSYTSADARTRPSRPSREVRGAAARARERLGRADTLVVSERSGRLAAMYATARDRFRVGEAESAADRQLAALSEGARGGRLPIVLILTVAILTAIATALVLTAIG